MSGGVQTRAAAPPGVRTGASRSVATLPAHAGALGLLVALATAVRFSTLSVQSYWLDEAVTVGLVRKSFGGMLGAIPGSESTPPLYYVVAWIWTRVFGSGEVGLRSLSALIGVATVPLVYAAAARLATRRVGLVAAALAAVNPLLVWFSQEARAYALLVLLTAASLAVFARLLERPTRGGVAGWAALSVLALATHYFAIFVLAPQAFLLLRRARGRPQWRATVVGIGALLVACAALVPLVAEQAGNDRAGFIRDIGLAKRIAQVPKQFLVGFDAPAEAVSSVAALALAALALWLLLRRADGRERRGAAVAAWIAVPAVVVPALLAVVGLDYLIARNEIAAWVPAVIVLAAGLGARRAGRLGLGATAALCVVSLAVVISVEANPSYQRGNWRGAASALGPLSEPRAIVITPLSGHIPLSLYAQPDLVALRGTTVPLREIDVMGVAAHGSGQTPAPPRPAVPPAPPAGFSLVERRETKTYTLLRYRSPVFRYVLGTGAIGYMTLTPGTADVFLQVPHGWVWVPPGTQPAARPPGHLP